jgi:hypothetical protein
VQVEDKSLPQLPCHNYLATTSVLLLRRNISCEELGLSDWVWVVGVRVGVCVRACVHHDNNMAQREHVQRRGGT